MARPKTEAADYKPITWRLPEKTIVNFRLAAQEENRPINTQLILCLEEWLAARTQRKHDRQRQATAH